MSKWKLLTGSTFAYPLLADDYHEVGKDLDLPTFEIAGATLYKRLTLVAGDGGHREGLLPVFPPAENADESCSGSARRVHEPESRSPRLR